MDVQEREPSIREEIGKVGVKNVKIFLKMTTGKKEIFYLPTIDLFINLPESKRGIHMSRLTETITDVLLNKARKLGGRLEEFGKEVLLDLERRHPYDKGEIAMRAVLFIKKETPVTKIESMEPYDVEVNVEKEGVSFRKTLIVGVIGSTACPHSIEKTNGKAHVQRARLRVELLVNMDCPVLLEELIAACEGAFSSATYTILKTEDEQSLVKRMYENPKFIEDVVRDCFDNVKGLGYKGLVKITGTSEESIHKHDVIAEIERFL